MTITVPRTAVQAAGDNGTDLTLTFAATPATASDIFVLVWSYNHTPVNGDVTDNQSNTYTRVALSGPYGGAPQSAAVFRAAANITASGTFTVTYANPAGAYCGGCAIEVDAGGGGATLTIDGAAADGGNASDANPFGPASFSGTTAQADEIAFGVIAVDSGGNAAMTPTWGGPAGSAVQVTSQPDGTAHEVGSADYKIFTATGTPTIGYSHAAETVAVAIALVVYKSSGGGGGGATNHTLPTLGVGT